MANSVRWDIPKILLSKQTACQQRPIRSVGYSSIKGSKAQSPFLSRAEWEANSTPPVTEAGDVVFAGLDLSASRDLTALVLAFPKDGHYIVPHFWLPEDGLRDKSQSEKVPYDVWADQGYLTTISGPVIQPEVIAMAVAEVAEEYSLQLLAYDRWRISDFKRELDNIGAEIPMQPFGQGFKDMAPAVDKLEQLVAERKLASRWASDLKYVRGWRFVQTDPAGNRKLYKAKSYKD